MTYIVSFGCVSFIVISNNNNICLPNNVYSCDSASLSFHVDIYVVVIVWFINTDKNTLFLFLTRRNLNYFIIQTECNELKNILVVKYEFYLFRRSMYQNRHQTEEKFISMPNQWECFVNMNVLDYIDEVPYDIAARMCACVLAQSSFYPTNMCKVSRVNGWCVRTEYSVLSLLIGTISLNFVFM